MPLSAGLSGVTSSRRCCRSSAVIGRRLISLPVAESHHTTSIVVRSSKRSQETVSNRLPERYSGCVDSHSRFVMLQALLEAGFRRIELAPTWIHVDNDPDKPRDVAFYQHGGKY